ncbi:MAG: hypothetical protein JSR18_04305 [Proteobacteria bacterium]|nr:hypothetical protein [Pseudomonadota bacterium]
MSTRLMRLLALCLVLAAGGVHAQAAYDAAFISQTVPSVIPTGSNTAISITMQNTGTATWVQREGDVFLATQLPQDNFYWCIQGNRYGSQSGNRVLLPHDVAPGAEVTFDFEVSPLACRFAAPAPLRFRMLSQRFGTFGALTPDPGTIVNGTSEYVSQQVPAIVPAGSPVFVSVTFKNSSTAAWTTDLGYALSSVDATGNTTWGVNPIPLPAAVAAGDDVTFSFHVLTPGTTGTYNFQWQLVNANGHGFGATSPATAVQVVAAGPANYGGLWWASPAGSESGWGINLAHQADTIYATWFTYDSTGKGVWMSMATTRVTSGTDAGSYTGQIYQSTGPAFSAVPFPPAGVRTTQVGTGKLTFTDATHGSFAYTVNGIAQVKAITLQVFGTQAPTCTYNLYTDLTKAYNYQDLWWVPQGAEAGWGVMLAHQGDTIFATWYTYDTDGTPLWLVVGAPKVELGVYSGTLYRTTGPPFNSVPFNPALVAGTPVGTATFTFTDGNTGSFDYTVGDVAQTKAITREVLVPPGTVCQ